MPFSFRAIPVRLLHGFCLMAALAAGPAVADVTVADLNPEAATGYADKTLVQAERFMAVTANPLATQAASLMLARDGSAADAAIAAQLVLALVEPQSSGLGGGAFLMYHDADKGRLYAYDGRETAPAAAQAERFMAGQRALPMAQAVNSGLSVGTPGLVRLLETLHQAHGRLPWAVLFEPAIELAEHGFPVSPRLHALIEENQALRDQPAAAAYFLDPDGAAWPVGHVLKNPQLAQVLRLLASQRADAFYHGSIARDIVAAVHEHRVPGDLAFEDLAAYQVVEREPLCADYRIYRLCGMPPPSSGTLAVLQMLKVLEPYGMGQLAPVGLEAVHLFSEAGRLAYADRDYYVADPAFVEVPLAGLLDPGYLDDRSALIDPEYSMGMAEPGKPPGVRAEPGQDQSPDFPSTSHIVVVDAQGNALSMTSSIEQAFGSKIFVRGFLLNNQLTDFSLNPVDANGRPVANRLEAGKRPRSSMAPMVIYRDGQPYMVLGSPGGSAIINYVAKVLVGVLDWNLDVQEAISLPNMGSRNHQTELEAGTELEELAEPLRLMGHEIQLLPFPSGLNGIVMDGQGLSGGTDPRREGLVLGD